EALKVESAKSIDSSGSPEKELAINAAKSDLVRLAMRGWEEEDPLHLIVLPPDHKNHSRREAQLLAIFGSARVLAPFRLEDGSDAKDQRWDKIVEFQRTVNQFAEGSLVDFHLKHIRDGGAELFNALFQGDVRRLYDQARYLHRNRKLNVVFTSMIP